MTLNQRATQRADHAARVMLLAFAIIVAAGTVARGFEDFGSLLIVALAGVMMSVPIALGLGAFTLAKGPILTALSVIFVIVTTALGAFVMWDSLTATESTAGIALFLLPIVETAAFVGVLILGLAGDAMLSPVRKAP